MESRHGLPGLEEQSPERAPAALGHEIQGRVQAWSYWSHQPLLERLCIRKLLGCVSSESKGLKQVTDSGAIEQLIDGIIAANPKQVEQYRSGQEKVFTFFVGQVMKESKGKANPAQVNEILQKKLKG